MRNVHKNYLAYYNGISIYSYLKANDSISRYLRNTSYSVELIKILYWMWPVQFKLWCIGCGSRKDVYNISQNIRSEINIKILEIYWLRYESAVSISDKTCYRTKRKSRSLRIKLFHFISEWCTIRRSHTHTDIVYNGIRPILNI